MNISLKKELRKLKSGLTSIKKMIPGMHKAKKAKKTKKTKKAKKAKKAKKTITKGKGKSKSKGKGKGKSKKMKGGVGYSLGGVKLEPGQLALSTPPPMTPYK